METSKISLPVIAGISIVAIVLSFFGGVWYGQSSATSSLEQRRAQFASGQFGNRGGNGGTGVAGSGQRRSGGAGGPGGFGGGFVVGSILEKDDKSITVKLTDGGSKIIFISEKTAINKTSAGSSEDLNKDEQVMVRGSQNADGSVTADSIQVGGALKR